MLVGYASVSTLDQNLHLQRNALAAARCERIFEERASGQAARLPARDGRVDYARNGDVVVVCRLHSLGRSLRDLVETVTVFGDRGVGLRSLHEAIDTTTPTGRLTFQVFAALAEFEAELGRERTRAGLAAARQRGRTLRRPRSLDVEQLEMARRMMVSPGLSARQVVEQLGVHHATLYRSLGGR